MGLAGTDKAEDPRRAAAALGGCIASAGLAWKIVRLPGGGTGVLSFLVQWDAA